MMKRAFSGYKIITICILLMFIAIPAVFAASLKQLPSDQSKPITIDGIVQAQMRGSDHFQVKAQLAPDGLTRDIYYSDKNKLIYGVNDYTDEVFAYDEDGEQAWSYTIEERGYARMLATENAIYVFVITSIFFEDVNDIPAVLYSFKPDGTINWKYTFAEPHQDYDFPAIHIDSKGMVYVQTKNSIAGIKDGKVVWEYKNNFNIYDLFSDSKGNLFFETNDYVLYKIDAQKKIQWKKSIGEGRLALLSDERYIIHTNHLKTAYIDTKTGKTVSSSAIQTKIYDGKLMPNDGKGNRYEPEKLDPYKMPSGNGLVKVDESGKILWHYKIRFSGYSAVRSVASDQYGNVYFNDNGGNLYSLDSNGNERFIIIVKDKGLSYFDLYASPKGKVIATNSKLGLYRIERKQ
ncbi:PQQ-binding-like beta-propeller repeat protein [Paenibacillus sp. NEAU-GSW1]|uniref:outer membrane protein assembly factor BamB family protein n=1 Tax=Paenibacillus sp. NEAU-GSW1 TaxID=2682486 RepID=UPI0012E2BA6D|nr:PQQ-binding-like beta-propeller repeat protein [Paenibacillus sp. NEAU-GSW1]MUT66948.1 PQQ-binding-like beta-propeller repeat protein [Paenibacillus sp. NEAU-GSW1]